jgi:hypothetical protein
MQLKRMYMSIFPVFFLTLLGIGPLAEVRRSELRPY